MTDRLFFKVANWSHLNKLAAEKGVKLPEDESKWSQAITDHVASDLPFINKYPTEIFIDEKDPKMGYAKGRMLIGNKATSPIIIRDRRLLPLDVFIYDEKFYPLSEKNLESLMMNKSMADKTVTPKEIGGTENTGLQQSSRPPYSAYTHRNQGYKMASVLDRLNSISPEDYNNAMTEINQDHELTYKIASKSKGILNRLEKLAKDTTKKKMSQEEQIETIRKIANRQNWPVNVFQMHKSANDSSIVFRTSSDICPLAYTEKYMSIKEARDMLPKATLVKLAQGENILAVKGRSAKTVNLPKEIAFPTENIEKFGHYDVVAENNSVYRGFVIPEVYDYDMNKIAGMKLFASEDTFAMQEKIAGRKVLAGPKQELPSSKIENGITGTFCFRYGEKVASIKPFTISSFPLTSGEQIEFEAMSMTGEPLQFTVMPGLAAASPGEKRGHYLIPSIWQFMRTGNYQQPIYKSSKQMTKTAMADTDIKKLELVWDGVTYQIIGPQVENISQQVQDLDPMKARFLLTAFGVPVDYADKLLSKARADGYTEFTADIKPIGQYVVNTNSHQHMDGSMDTKYASMISRIRLVPWIKLAAEADDKETVDSVLSLQFINPQNLSEFADSIDDFREAQTKLAKLLVATRLGIKQVDAESVKMAMEQLSNVIEDLEIMDSVFKEKQKKR